MNITLWFVINWLKTYWNVTSISVTDCWRRGGILMWRCCLEVISKVSLEDSLLWSSLTSFHPISKSIWNSPPVRPTTTNQQTRELVVAIINMLKKKYDMCTPMKDINRYLSKCSARHKIKLHHKISKTHQLTSTEYISAKLNHAILDPFSDSACHI